MFRTLSYKVYSLKQVREMARCVEVTAANLDNLSLIPRIHIMVGKNQMIPRSCPWNSQGVVTYPYKK